MQEFKCKRGTQAKMQRRCKRHSTLLTRMNILTREGQEKMMIFHVVSVASLRINSISCEINCSLYRKIGEGDGVNTQRCVRIGQKFGLETHDSLSCAAQQHTNDCCPQPLLYLLHLFIVIAMVLERVHQSEVRGET